MKLVKPGRLLFASRTKAELLEEDMILLDGEIVIEQDTGKMKAGDGKKRYSDLGYLNVGPKEIGRAHV